MNIYELVGKLRDTKINSAFEDFNLKVGELNNDTIEILIEYAFAMMGKEDEKVTKNIGSVFKSRDSNIYKYIYIDNAEYFCGMVFKYILAANINEMYHTYYKNRVSNNLYIILSHICTNGSEDVKNCVRESKVKLMEMIYKNIQYFGIIESFKILLDFNFDLLVEKKDIDKMIGEISKVTDYRKMVNWVHLIRCLLARGCCGPSDVFTSPLVKFYKFFINEKTIQEIINRILEIMNQNPNSCKRFNDNKLNSVVGSTIYLRKDAVKEESQKEESSWMYPIIILFTYFTKIFENPNYENQYSIQKETHSFNVPFIPKAEKKGFIITTDIKYTAYEKLTFTKEKEKGNALTCFSFFFKEILITNSETPDKIKNLPYLFSSYIKMMTNIADSKIVDENFLGSCNIICFTLPLLCHLNYVISVKECYDFLFLLLTKDIFHESDVTYLLKICIPFEFKEYKNEMWKVNVKRIFLKNLLSRWGENFNLKKFREGYFNNKNANQLSNYLKDESYKYIEDIEDFT